MAVFAGLGLAGCASVDELKNTMSGWFAKFPGGHEGAYPDEMPDAVPMIGPDKILKEEASKASKTTEKAARKLQRQQTVERPNKAPVSVSAKAVRPQEANAQSAPSPTAPSRLRNLWPEPPAPGSFSR
jgi:hypothetical protein